MTPNPSGWVGREWTGVGARPERFELPTAWFVGAIENTHQIKTKLDGPPSHNLPLRFAQIRQNPSRRYDFATFLTVCCPQKRPFVRPNL